MSNLDKAALVLVVLGALNWGLIGVLEVNGVDSLTKLVTKDNAMVNRVIYVLVGIAALLVAYNKLKKQ
jgi:uncharacterized membrane protein YuzA (DUF378 family)